MAKRKKYTDYDPWVKAAISSTGRVDLFPSFNIPRTTANYWIKQKYVVNDPILESLTEALNEARSDHSTLHKKASEHQATKALLKDVFGLLGFKLRWKQIESKEMRDKILDSISKAMEFTTRDSCLEILDLSISRYKRWKRERRGCGLRNIKLRPKQREACSL